jgi:hypothetical protein
VSLWVFRRGLLDSDGDPVHLVQSAQLHLADRAGLLQPTEALLDQPPTAQADGIAGVPRGSAVEGVDAGVDDEADSAERVGVETAIVTGGVLVEANLFAELLGVEGPAFGVRAEASMEAELGQALELLLDIGLFIASLKARPASV